MKKIFISHSSSDKKYVEYLVDLIEAIGVPSGRIFCTSLANYGVPLGEDFLARIKEELNDDTVVLFIISEAFYKSPVCLCEMGASWVKSGVNIPILIPPFDFSGLKGVISMTQGFKINDKSGLNSLYLAILQAFGIKGLDMNVWERKRDKFVSDVNRLIFDSCSISGQPQQKPKNGEKTALKDKETSSKMEEFNAIIKDVTDKLAKLPWIVRKGLYYHFAGRDFVTDNLNGEDESYYAAKAAEDDYLIIDGRWITLNARDPKVKKAIESLNELKCFLENAGQKFHDEFESKYEICAKIESRKFWRMMEIL